MQHKEYNGWFNYETWLVKLWLDNEESSYEFQRELTQEHDNACDLGKALRAYIEENNPLEDAGLYADLLDAALSEVNWEEIAEKCLEEFKTDTDKE